MSEFVLIAGFQGVRICFRPSGRSQKDLDLTTNAGQKRFPSAYHSERDAGGVEPLATANIFRKVTCGHGTSK